MTVFLLNSAVIPGDGCYHATTIPPHEARAIVKARGFVSHVGHAGAAEVLSEILGVHVPVCREPWKCLPGDTAIAIRFNGGRRLDPCRELAADEFRRAGYKLIRIERLY